MTEIIFKNRFFETFLDFQRETRKNSVTAFANYLTRHNSYGVKFSQQLVSGWLNGDYKPSEKYAPALADIMGNDIYDILDLPHPDLFWKKLSAAWKWIPEEGQRVLSEQGVIYAEQNKKEKDAKSSIVSDTEDKAS